MSDIIPLFSTSFSIAKYYCDIKKNNIVFTGNNIYINNNNRWQEVDKYWMENDIKKFIEDKIDEESKKANLDFSDYSIISSTCTNASFVLDVLMDCSVILLKQNFVLPKNLKNRRIEIEL